MNVVLRIPVEEKWKTKTPSLHGEHFGYDGKQGTVIASAGKDGAWVMFEPPNYVGCPIKWLRKIDHATQEIS